MVGTADVDGATADVEGTLVDTGAVEGVTLTGVKGLVVVWEGESASAQGVISVVVVAGPQAGGVTRKARWPVLKVRSSSV